MITDRTERAALPVVRAASLADRQPEHQWLVEPLWARGGVGIIGGSPKCGKSWLGLDLALSVASATPCLGRFPVRDPGRALVYLAEDALHAVKQRLLGLCRPRGLDLATVPLDVITAPSLRLDLERDRARLRETLRVCRPRMLLLDPFVRLHRIDENSAAEVSALLAFLRELQREHDVAIVVAHHARKSGPAGAHAGHGLRGSGDFHAWTDSALYVRRNGERITVVIEHRAAAAPEPFEVALVVADDEGAAHLEVASAGAAIGSDPAHRERLLAAIATLECQSGGASRDALRAALRLRTETLGVLLAGLAREGIIVRDRSGWRRVPVPTLAQEAERNGSSSRSS